MMIPPLAHGTGLEILVVVVFYVVSAFVLVSLAVIVADVIAGALLVAVLRRGRHLFWALPILNLVLWPYAIKPGLLHFWSEMPTGRWIDVGAAVLLVLDAWVCAAMMGPFARLARGRQKAQALDSQLRHSRTPAPSDPPERTGYQPPAMPARGWFGGLREGLATPWEGFRYLCANPSLWRYAILPIVINLLITLVVLCLFVLLAVAGISYLNDAMPGDWYWVIVKVVCAIALLLAAAGLSLAVWLLLQGVLCGYFYSILASRIEVSLGLPAESMCDVPLRYQVVDAVRDLVSLTGLNLGLLLLHLLPVIGSLLAFGGGLYFNSFALGIEYLDYPMALRGVRREAKRRFAKRHRPQALGLGAAVWLLNFVPILNAVPLTTAAAGAVLLHRRLAAADDCGIYT